MSPSLGWLIALATCYPWLLAGDLLSDLTAPWHLLVFLPGTLLVTPFLYLRTWQAVLLAGCVGLAFEARRPITPGTFALLLMIVSVVAVAWRDRLNSKPDWLAGVTLNMLACALALPTSLAQTHTWSWGQWIYAYPLEIVFAGLIAFVLHRPITAWQTRLLEHSGMHKIQDT
jgi:hypothetical protein